jgi:hypothetical protein
MYANVDENGDLGSNVDAVSEISSTAGLYTVTFSKPIGSCAATPTNGYGANTAFLLTVTCGA